MCLFLCAFHLFMFILLAFFMMFTRITSLYYIWITVLPFHDEVFVEPLILAFVCIFFTWLNLVTFVNANVKKAEKIEFSLPIWLKSILLLLFCLYVRLLVGWVSLHFTVYLEYFKWFFPVRCHLFTFYWQKTFQFSYSTNKSLNKIHNLNSLPWILVFRSSFAEWKVWSHRNH